MLCWLIRKTKGTIILLLAVIYILKIHTFISDMTITALLFFSIGAWFSLQKKGFAEFSVKRLRVTLPLWLILIAVNVYYDGARTDTGLIFYPWMVITGVFAFIGIIAKWGTNTYIYKNKAVTYAANNTFFIYVVHGLFGLDITWRVLNRLPMPNIVQYLIAPFIAIAICLAVLWMMKRYMPRVTRVMIGER